MTTVQPFGALFRQGVCLCLLAALPCMTIRADDTPEADEGGIKARFEYSFNDVSSSLVLVTCKSQFGDSSGSGFIARMDGKTYIFTNQHVIMGADSIEFQTVTGTTLHPTGVELALKRDIARLPIPDQEALVISDDLAMGVPLAVFGNSEGGGVATELYGKVTGVGADLVEVSAEFVAGNSGSPVLNLDKEVIGIASYVRFTEPSKTNENTKFENKARRFCYRLTGVQWAPVNWKYYNNKYGKAYRQTEDTVDSIFAIIERWWKDPFGPVPTGKHPEMSLNGWASSHNRMVDRIVELADKGRATQSQLNHTNEKIREEIGRSTASLSAVCKPLSRDLAKESERSDLTGFLRDEFEGYAYALQYASEAIDYFGTKLATVDYFHFE